MAATVVIPARYASTRFPGKMLAAETGKPLVQHVVEQVKKAKKVRNVIGRDPRAGGSIGARSPTGFKMFVEARNKATMPPFKGSVDTRA